MRELRDHEKRLLRKVNFISWRKEGNTREAKVLRRYLIQRREDYLRYNKMVGQIHHLVKLLGELPLGDAVREDISQRLRKKLFDLALLDSDDTSKKQSLAMAVKNRIKVSAFCRRRLPVVMVVNKMADNVKAATTFVEQGHVRVGPNVVTDPSFLVTRNMEDYVTWVDSSKIRRAIAQFNDQEDDYDLLGT